MTSILGFPVVERDDMPTGVIVMSHPDAWNERKDPYSGLFYTLELHGGLYAHVNTQKWNGGKQLYSVRVSGNSTPIEGIESLDLAKAVALTLLQSVVVTAMQQIEHIKGESK